MFSGFVGPFNHHQYYEEKEKTSLKKLAVIENHEKNKKLDENENYVKITKLVRNAFFTILKAKVKEFLFDVSNTIQEKRFYGTYDLNRFRLV